MKRKTASLLGNVLMALGLVVMVVGVGYSILNQLPQFNLPQFLHTVPCSVFLLAACSGWRGLASAVTNKSATATGGFAITTNAVVVIIANAIAKP